MKFRCKQTGNVIEVVGDAAIQSMKQMPHYEVVEEKPTLTLKKKEAK